MEGDVRLERQEPQRALVPVKPGYKTTEFWLSTAAGIVAALLASDAFSDSSEIGKALGIAAVVLTSLGYTVSRTKAKAAGGA